jgi:hypothetical protein
MTHIRRPKEARFSAAQQSTSLATCPACGKQAYTSKASAKRAARIIYPGTRMRAYNCDRDRRWWHLTSQNAARTEQMRDYYAPPCTSSECDC